MASVEMQAGDTAGHFEILELLGSGVLATVYRARNTRLDRIVALKILRSGADEETLRRFREEARRMVRIQTPYVINVYTLEELNVGPAIEMEYLEGGSLADRLRLGPSISVAQGRRYLENALLGLKAIHEEGIVHRDIKPANILFDRNGQLRLGDFGIAVHEGDPATLYAATLQYAAPELIVHGKFDRRVDLYSLGMTAYEMFLGSERYQRVFREVVDGGDDLQPTNWMAWHADPARKAPPLKGSIEIDEETSDLVARLMEKNREQRFQSADAALARLRRTNAEPEGNPPTVELDPPGSRHAPLMVGALVALVVVAAGLALYAIFRSPKSSGDTKENVADGFSRVALLMDFEERGIHDDTGYWVVDDSRAHTGRFSAHTPARAAMREAIREFRVRAPNTAGRVSFFYLVASEFKENFFAVWVNEETPMFLGDTGGAWKQAEILLRPGPNNNIEWDIALFDYGKPFNLFEDRVWIDDIQFLTPSRKEDPNLIDFETGSIPSAAQGGWGIDGSRSYRGSHSAHSPSFPHNDDRSLRVTAPPGKSRVSFYYYVSSEVCCDYLSVKVGGGPSHDFRDTAKNWRSAEIELNPDQRNEITWTYPQDASKSHSNNRAWVDDIEFHK